MPSPIGGAIRRWCAWSPTWPYPSEWRAGSSTPAKRRCSRRPSSQRRLQARPYATPEGASALSEYVFHAGDGRPVVDFKHSWVSACRKAGLPGKLFHDLRRTAVRDMIRAGVPQSVAMRISGHRTTAIFLRYDITSDDDKRAALLKMQEHRKAQPVRPATPTVELAPPPPFTQEPERNRQR